MKKNQFVRSFTLIELLIAISIFSVIILSVYSAFNTGVLSYYRMDSAFNVYQTARTILNRMELDLKNTFVYSQDISKGGSKFGGTNQSLDFYTIVDTYENGQVSTNIYHIEYKFSEPTLTRIFHKGQDVLKSDSTGVTQDLSSDVKEIYFEYGTGDTNNPWQKNEPWPKDDAQKIKLPLAVKIELVLIERDKRGNEIGDVKFNKTIYLALGKK